MLSLECAMATFESLGWFGGFRTVLHACSAPDGHLRGAQACIFGFGEAVAPGDLDAEGNSAGRCAIDGTLPSMAVLG